MFIDGRELPADHVVETDICIIGAGAVGISRPVIYPCQANSFGSNTNSPWSIWKA